MLYSHPRIIAGAVLVLISLSVESSAQDHFEGLEHLFTPPRHYVTYFTEEAPVIDGALDDAAWGAAEWSKAFVPIEGLHKPRPPLDTRIKMVWNDTCLFIAAEMEDPHVWATLTNHDDIVFYDNDFEVFIDPDNNVHEYFEIEVNALNTIFDLFMAKPYRNGGSALISWNIAGLKSAVQVRGTLNDPSDTDEGWTVEMAVPFKAISMGNHVRSPKDGSLWRINFSRVHWDTDIREGAYEKKTGKDGRPLAEHNWVWSPQGVVNMHFPERWGYLLFSKEDPANGPVEFILPFDEKQKQYLWLVYYKQKAYYDRHGYYADRLEKLGLESKIMVERDKSVLRMDAAKHQFMATAGLPGHTGWCINQEGAIKKFKLLP